VRALVGLPFLLLLGLATWQEAARPRVEVELVYLANEGFLVRCGEHALLLDAFVTEPYGEYAAVPAELFADLVARRPPFADVDLALTSHVHRDHFQASAAKAFLAANPATPFLAAAQVQEELAKELADASDARRALLPEASQRLAAEAGGIRVELLRLPHSGGARTATVQNLGQRIELGDASLLHVGDADLETRELAGYELARSPVDVAFVPYWWLGSAEDLARTRAVTGARHLVAVHVPPGEVASEKARLAALDPAILVFERSGEERRLTLER
jgi:L-ascorbate metabolism protein UlaG (beta-lactamase superfamily)